MRDEGALDDPPVQRIFGLHVWPQLPVGVVTAVSMVLMALTRLSNRSSLEAHRPR